MDFQKAPPAVHAFLGSQAWGLFLDHHVHQVSERGNGLERPLVGNRIDPVGQQCARRFGLLPRALETDAGERSDSHFAQFAGA